MSYHQLIVDIKKSIIFALNHMDECGRKLLLVFSDNQYCGLLSVGDIQRAIIKNVPLATPIEFILRKDVTVARDTQSIEDIKCLMLQHRMEFIPLLNANNKLLKVYMWEDLFPHETNSPQNSFTLPVIIMAGGKGTRLKPLTNIIPKPLIPIGDKTFIEDIMDRFVECGSSEFYVSVNYKAEIIRYYFENLQKSKYSISCFQEDKPLGTAGSLTLVKNKINSTFFVTNCDILINEDYSQILNYHYENRNELTIVAAVKNYSIPYGILNTKENGLLDSISEKPELTYKINTGFYILEPHLLDEIPEGEFYHITYLIEKLKTANRRVGVFPVSEKSWVDIGNWSEYLSIINKFVE